MASLGLLPSDGTVQSLSTIWHSDWYTVWFLGWLNFSLLFPSGLSLLLLYITSMLFVFSSCVWVEQINWNYTAGSATINLEFHYIFAKEHVCKKLSIFPFDIFHYTHIFRICFCDTENFFIFITLVLCYTVYVLLFFFVLGLLYISLQNSSFFHTFLHFLPFTGHFCLLFFVSFPTKLTFPSVASLSLACCPLQCVHLLYH